MDFPDILVKVVDLATAGPFVDEEGDGFLDPSERSTMQQVTSEFQRVGKPLRAFLQSLSAEDVLKLYVLMEVGENKISPADFSEFRRRLHRPNPADAIRRMVERRSSLGVYLSPALAFLEQSQLDANGPF